MQERPLIAERERLDLLRLQQSLSKTRYGVSPKFSRRAPGVFLS